MLDTIDSIRMGRGHPAPPVITPCDSCRHARRCFSESLGCEALVLYKRVNTSPKRWNLAPRFPTAEAFTRAHTPVVLRQRPPREVFETELFEEEEAIEEESDE
jgi:hypothetical protein